MLPICAENHAASINFRKKSDIGPVTSKARVHLETTTPGSHHQNSGPMTNYDTRFCSPSIEFVLMLQQSVLESKAILDPQHQRAGCTCSTKSPCQCGDKNAATNKTKIAFRGRSFCSFPSITHSLAHLLSREWGLSNVLWQTRPGSTGCSKSRHVCVVPANSPTTTPRPISCRSPCSKGCITLSLAHLMHRDSESISQFPKKGRYGTCSTKSVRVRAATKSGKQG